MANSIPAFLPSLESMPLLILSALLTVNTRGAFAALKRTIGLEKMEITRVRCWRICLG
jgi:hypothetical protein